MTRYTKEELAEAAREDELRDTAGRLVHDVMGACDYAAQVLRALRREAMDNHDNAAFLAADGALQRVIAAREALG